MSSGAPQELALGTGSMWWYRNKSNKPQSMATTKGLGLEVRVRVRVEMEIKGRGNVSGGRQWRAGVGRYLRRTGMV